MHPVSQKPILKFVGIQRRDTGEWAIPGVSKLKLKYKIDIYSYF